MERARPPKIAVISFITRFAAGVGLMLIAGSIFVGLFVTAPRPTPAIPDANAPRVLVMRAQPVPVRREWEGFGTVRALTSADVPARVTAVVVERPHSIHPGSTIAKGDLIIQLDDRDFLRQAEIIENTINDLDSQVQRLDVEEQSWSRRVKLAAEEVQISTTELERIKKAFENKAASQRELDQARQSLIAAERNEIIALEELGKIAPRRAGLKAQRDSQQASLTIARLNVDRCRIVSPITGILQNVDVEIGESLVAGQRVARVVNLVYVEVPLMLPASARRFVQVGDEVTVNSTGIAEQAWTANVARIAPEQDESTRTMTVYIEVEQNPTAPTILSPGMYVRGVVKANLEENRSVVPRRALNSERVMVVVDGRVSSRDVDVDFHLHDEDFDLGVQDTQWVVLKSTLSEDTLVVIDASRTLAEGSSVTPIIAGQSVADAQPTAPAHPVDKQQEVPQ